MTYSNLSEYAAHPAPEGFVLISPNNMMTQIGPFPDEDRIRAFLQDLARFLASATMTFAGHLSAETAGDLLQRVAYMRAVRDWSANRVPGLYERLARDSTRSSVTLLGGSAPNRVSEHAYAPK